MDTFANLNKKLALLLGFLSLVLSFSAEARSYWYPSLHPSMDAGVMVGYTGGPRKGVIVNAATSGSSVESGSQDSGEVGAQVRFLLGSECCFRPFLYINGARPIGTPLSILFGRILPPFTLSTRMTITSNWLARVGLGMTTYWLYDTFQVGIGAGALVLNQTLETYLGEATTTTFNQNKTSIRPTLMGSITWILCPRCLAGHDALVTAQVTADSQPVIDQSVPSSIGVLNTHVNQAWVPRGDLIFSISLG